MTPDIRPAALDESTLADVRRLEQELGTTLVAYEPRSPYADLDADQVAALQRAESQLGVRLLAYRPEAAER